MRARPLGLLAIASMTVMLTACGGNQSVADKSSEQRSNLDAARSEDEGRSRDAWKPAIRAAAIPAEPCGWIPVADVEAVIGKLAEPPRKEDGCRYTLVVPESVAAKRQQLKATQEKISENLRKAFGTAAAEEADARSPLFDALQDPRSYAVTVNVDVNGGVEGELASSAVAREFGLPAGVEMDKLQTQDARTPAEWDDARRVPYGFSGRVGHVRVTVAGQSPDVPIEPMQTLAARVRDRIPDLPFPVTNPYQVLQRGTKDACSLLTRAEAETVLGPLSIEPYRSSSNWPPLAHGEGFACAYFTPGHHVFVLSPTWEGGAQSFKIETGLGGLIGIVAPQESVVIKGPWERAHVSGTSGALLFLKGDRLLEVYYRTSRATRGQAVKLAATAMQRLAP